MGGGGFFMPAGSHTAGTGLPQLDVGPVGIVCTDIEQAADYLDFPLGPYVIIRTVRDVPAKLGGVALLTHDLPDGLADALARACGIG